MMQRREFLSLPLLFSQRRALNVVLIVADDLGMTDLGCYGSKFYETPNLDRLAASGTRFTQAYSACTVCSPSRAAILTGKYPARLHLTDWIAGHDYPFARMKPPAWTQYLPLEEVTLAEALKPNGYRTASIGKWHLTPTENSERYYPEAQGFDLNLAGTRQGQPPSYFSPYGIPNLPDGPKGEYLTDREFDEAGKFIEANQKNPFFVYLPLHTVHTPLQAKQPVIDRYKAKARPDAPQRNPTYAAMIESMDENVGKLLKHLDSSGLTDRTIVLFTSDNGGLIPSTNTNLGLRAGKGSAYEGGVRVPFIVRWPGVTRGGTTCNVPVCGIDIAPTISSALGRKMPPADGASILPLLQDPGGKSWKRDTLFWHYPHYHPGGAKPYSAVRYRNWRLIEFHEDQRVELYDLANDPEETKDLSASESRTREDLHSRLQKWRKDVNAQMPVPNEKFDPERAGLTGAQARKL